MNDNVKIDAAKEELTFINDETLSCSGTSISAISSGDIYAGDLPSNLGIGGTAVAKGKSKGEYDIYAGDLPSNLGIGGISENNTWDGMYIGDPPPNSSDDKFTIVPSTGNITFTNYPAPKKPRYSVFLLSRREMPKKVFICGRLTSLGNIGDDVQVAYDGRDYLVIAPNELTAMYTSNKITVAVEYDEVMEHYEVETNNILSYSEIQYEDNSNVLKTRLVSSVPQ